MTEDHPKMIPISFVEQVGCKTNFRHEASFFGYMKHLLSSDFDRNAHDN